MYVCIQPRFSLLFSFSFHFNILIIFQNLEDVIEVPNYSQFVLKKKKKKWKVLKGILNFCTLLNHYYGYKDKCIMMNILRSRKKGNATYIYQSRTKRLEKALASGNINMLVQDIEDISSLTGQTNILRLQNMVWW